MTSGQLAFDKLSSMCYNNSDTGTEVIADLAAPLNTVSDYLIFVKKSQEDFAGIYRLVARSTTTMTDEE